MPKNYTHINIDDEAINTISEIACSNKLPKSTVASIMIDEYRKKQSINKSGHNPITLSKDDHRYLKELARKRSMTMKELISDIVDNYNNKEIIND